MREALRAGDEALKALRVAVQATQEQRSHIELELVRKQSELKYLDETSRKELSCAGRGMLRARPETPNPRADAIVEAEQRYQEVRARIEALAPVNPQALEEYQEAQQRYEFLNTQRQDLLDSIRDTEKAIQELDGVSRRFTEAFEAINAHFKDMFQTLFGGGTGEMRLTDEANLAESGIDIMARLPASGCRTCAAFGRREIADRDGALDGDLPLPAEPVLHSGRSGRAARRTQHRAPRRA